MRRIGQVLMGVFAIALIDGWSRKQEIHTSVFLDGREIARAVSRRMDADAKY